LRIERKINQRVIVEVDHAVVIEVAVEPSGAIVVEAGVDARVVVEVDQAVEVGVARSAGLPYPRAEGRACVIASLAAVADTMPFVPFQPPLL